MAQTEALKQFIQSRPHLIWYVRDFERLSEAAIVEQVLNYGTWADVCELIRISGMASVAADFRQRASLERTNYRPEIKNFFQLYFDRHAV